MEAMTTKERIIRQAITDVTDKIKSLEFLLTATPLTEICSIRREANKLLDENPTTEQRTSSDFMRKWLILANAEKEQFAIAEKQKNSSKLTKQLVDLQSELSDLQRELYYIETKK